MVNGIASFREKFRNYLDCYTVIGGAACDILMGDAGFQFRATKDIDMILVLEGQQEGFAKAFWEYVREGGYRCGWRNNKEVHFYRFTDPEAGYPVQIELFSRDPGYYPDIDSGIVPIHIDDDVSSLSAILLNEDFYRFMMEGRKVVDGINVLDAPYLIPFKMYAWLDLLDKKAQGEHVDEKNLKKHKLDVFRLLAIVPGNTAIPVSGPVADSIQTFFKRIENEPLPLSQIGISISLQQAIALLKKIYIFP